MYHLVLKKCQSLEYKIKTIQLKTHTDRFSFLIRTLAISMRSVIIINYRLQLRWKVISKCSISEFTFSLSSEVSCAIGSTLKLLGFVDYWNPLSNYCRSWKELIDLIRSKFVFASVLKKDQTSNIILS